MPSIRDFSGGVLNQELLGKDSGAGIMIDANNVLSSWNGELRKRTGTAWLTNLSEYKRIIPFRKPDGDDLILLAGDGVLDAYEYINDFEIKPFYVPVGDAPVFPDTGWAGTTTNGKYEIKTSSSSEPNTWGAGFDVITERGPKYYGRGSLYTGGYLSATNTTAFIEISSTDPQVFQSATIRWCLTCSGNRKGHYKGWMEPIIQYSDDGSTWTSVLTTIKNPIPFGGTDAYRASYPYGVGSSQKTENYVVFNVSNANYINPHRYWRIFFQTRIPNNSTFGSERLEFFVSDVKYVSSQQSAFHIENNFFTADNVADIKFAQNNNTMILVNGTDKPLNITYQTGVLSVEEHVMSSFDFSAQGYPKCVYFYQNRLFFGGFTLYPTRVWGSAFGNFSDFLKPASDSILPTSPIYVDCVEIKNIIENLWGGTNALYCLSSDGVSMIDAQGGIVATDNIEFKLRNREPVDGMTPTVKDDIMIYLGRDKRKIFMTDFDFVVQRFKANNISKSYDNFFKTGIRELHFIPNKSSLIYGLLENGKAFCLLLDTQGGKNAIFPMSISGQIWDLQPVKYGDKTNLCMITQRSGGFMLEHKFTQEDQELMDFLSLEDKQQYTKNVCANNNVYLDCSCRRTYEQDVEFIKDLPYSAGQIVSVYADGVYVGDKKIAYASNGQIYAWVSDTEGTLFTDTDTPDTLSIIYDEYGEQTNKFGVISSVSSDSLTTHIVTSGQIGYYAWKATTDIDVTPISGYSPAWIGKFVRDRNLDIVGDYSTSNAWVQGGETGYTTKDNPSVGEKLRAKGGRGYYDKADIVGVTQFSAWTKTKNPNIGDSVYNENFEQIGTITNVNTVGIEIDGLIYTRHSDSDKKNEEPIDKYVVFNRSQDLDVAYDSSTIKLDEPAKEIVLGIPYGSYSVIKLATPYTSKKHVKEIATYFINTGYLEMGNSFDNLQPILNNMYDNIDILNKPVLLNGEYVKTIDKTVDNLPYVILKSDKALPFMITGIDFKVDYSNYQGGI